jgi:hypothetical protein
MHGSSSSLTKKWAREGCRRLLSTACGHSIARSISRPMKMALLILGLLALLMGLLWVGQGAGLVHWPASSFMIDQRPWVARGALLAVVGLILILWSRRRER